MDLRHSGDTETALLANEGGGAANDYKEYGPSSSNFVFRKKTVYISISMIVITIIGLIIALIVVGTTDSSDSCDAPALSVPASVDQMTYMHLYNDNGTSRWKECQFQHWEKLQPPGFQPFYLEHPEQVAAAVGGASAGHILGQVIQFVPANFPGNTWHKDPQIQLITLTSGRGMWTSEDGVQKFFGPGEFMLGDDIGTKGHLSEPIDGKPMVVYMTSFNLTSADTINRPCWL